MFVQNLLCRAGKYTSVVVLSFFIISIRVGHAAGAEPLNLEQKIRPLPVSLTLSGGVSLGAYQAGFLAYLSELYQKNPDKLQIKLITGASAGSLNALFAAMNFCSAAAPLQKSLLYTAWVDLQLKQFASKADEHDPRALLSRKAFLPITEKTHEVWQAGLPENCDFVLGVTVTRVQPKKVGSSGGFSFLRQAEKFALRIRGRGLGHPPSLTNYLASGESAVLQLDLPSDSNAQFFALRDLLIASSAFPLIFAPQKIRFCEVAAENLPLLEGADQSCPDKRVQEAEFIDGGTLDNKPLDLAVQLVRAGLVDRDGRWQWLALPVDKEPLKERNLLFLSVDLSTNNYPSSAKSSNKNSAPAFLSYLLGDYLHSARDQNLLATVNSDPRFSTQIASPKNDFPRASEGVSGFFGFIDRDFRIFDFYLGMLEAEVLFRDSLALELREGQGLPLEKIRWPDGSKPGWEGFSCLRDLYGKAIVGDSCSHLQGIAKARLVAVAKTSLAQLNSNCSTVKLTDEASGCKRLTPAIHKMLGKLDSLRQQGGESDLEFQLRLLQVQEFALPELGLGVNDTQDATGRLKSAALEQINKMADKQPDGSGTAVTLGGPLLLNWVEPLPPERQFFLDLGRRGEVGVKWALPYSVINPPSLSEFVTLGSQIEDSGNLIPRISLGMDVRQWGTDWFKIAPAMGVAYRLPWAGQDPPGFLLQPELAFIALERLRLKVQLEDMPSQSLANYPLRLLFYLGISVYF